MMKKQTKHSNVFIPAHKHCETLRNMLISHLTPHDKQRQYCSHASMEPCTKCKKGTPEKKRMIETKKEAPTK